MRLYVKGRGRGVPSKSAIFNNVVFFAVVFEQTPPRYLFRSASKLVSTGAEQTLCSLRLYIEGRGHGVPSNLVLWSFFPMFVNKLPPGNLSVLL